MQSGKADESDAVLLSMNFIPRVIYRRIAHRPTLVKIVDNIGWLFFDKILRMGVGLFVGVWIARYLGPEQFGLLNFALAFTGLFGAIATLGLPGIVVRDIVREPESAKLTLGTAALLQLVGGLVSYLLILGVIVYLRADDSLARSIVAILGSMMLFKASEIAVYWFESQVKSKYTVWVQNGVFLLFAAIKVNMILQQAPLIAFAWAMLAEAAAVALILLVVFWLRGPEVTSLRATSARAKSLLHDSWPLVLSAIAVTMYMKIDQIMLGQIIGNEAVGIYSAAVRISEVWYFVPMVIVASVFPALTRSKSRCETEYRELLQKLYDIMILIGVSVAVPMTFLAGYLVTLLFGESYTSAGVVLAVYVWAGIFVGIGIVSARFIMIENKQLLVLFLTILGVLTNVGLNALLIPLYSESGAAFSTLLSYVFVNYLVLFAFKELRYLAKMITRGFFCGMRFVRMWKFANNGIWKK